MRSQTLKHISFFFRATIAFQARRCLRCVFSRPLMVEWSDLFVRCLGIFCVLTKVSQADTVAAVGTPKVSELLFMSRKKFLLCLRGRLLHLCPHRSKLFPCLPTWSTGRLLRNSKTTISFLTHLKRLILCSWRRQVGVINQRNLKRYCTHQPFGGW